MRGANVRVENNDLGVYNWEENGSLIYTVGRSDVKGINKYGEISSIYVKR